MALEKIKPFIVDATQDFVFGNATITGNITSTNANLGNLAVANFFSGTLTTSSQPNITSVGTLSNLSVTSNVSAGNIKTNNLLYANGSPWQIGTTTTVSGSNTQVQFNDASSFGASANFTFDKSTNTLTVTNLVTNGSGISNITGSNVIGQVPNASVAATVYTNAQPNITSLGTLTSLSVTGNITSGNADLGNTATANYFVGSGNNLSNIQGSNVTGAVSYATTANSVAGANVSGAVTYAGTANAVAGANVFGQVGNSLVSGTVYTAAQPNITSVGTLANLTSDGTVNFTNASNVALGAVGNVHITGGSSGQYLQTDGSGTLSWASISGTTASNIANGNSNVNIPSANGNVNISAVGNANVVVVTGTGANITGYANISGNVTAGNISTSGAGGNISGANVISANTFTATANITAQYYIGDGSLLTGIATNPSNIANGNSNVTVTANGNVTTSVSGNANVLVVTGTGANITGYANITGNVTAGNISTSGSGGNITGANVISANTFTASGNITATNANLGNAVVSNYFIGSLYGTANLATYATTANAVAGANVSGAVAYATTANSVAGANVSGQVGNALIAGTVYTNAQPNITSVGTLSSLSVTGDISGANLVLSGNLTVSGTTTSVNSTVTRVVDPIFELGGGANGASLSSNDNKDRGTLLHYYTGSTATDAFVGWDNSNAEFAFGSNVSVTSEVVTFNSLGNVRAGFFIGNGSQLTGVTALSSLSAGYIANGTSNVNIPAINGNVNISSAGNANIVVVTGTGVNVNGTLNSTGNLTALNANLGNAVSANYFIGSGAFLTSVAAVTAATVTTNAQPNITSVGTLTTLTVGNATANSTFGNGTITATGNISFTGANVSLGAVGNLKITGGTSGYFLTTDGAGNLSWGAASGGGGATASGSNTEIQFNDGGTSLGSSANLTFDKSTNTFATARIVASNGANLGSNVANVYIGGGSNNQILKTDGSGNLAWIAQPVASITVDNFTGDGTTTAFTLTVTPTSINQTVVNYNGTFQLRAAYTVSGTTLTFSEAPVSGALIEVTTTLGAISGAGAFVTRSYTGNGTQSTFSVTSGSTVSSVIVTENGLVQIPTTDYTISGGTLTFVTAPANGISIQIRELAIAVATPSGIIWSITSSNITMSSNNGYFVDTSGGAKTMTLPSSASLGDTIRINDLAGSFATNNLTVARNGHKIQGDTNDLLVDTDQTSFGLVYSNSTYGWKVLEL